MASQPINEPGVGPDPKPVNSPLQTLEYAGAPLGMVTAWPKQEIADGAAVYLQDVLVDKPGEVRTRGGLDVVNGSLIPYPGYGMAGTFDPANNYRVAIVAGPSNSGNAFLWFLSGTTLATLSSTSWPALLSIVPAPAFSGAPVINGGAYISTASAYEEGSNPTVISQLWRGASFDVYGTGTITTTRGSTAVVGVGTSWTTTVNPGAFLYNASSVYVGTVKTVTDNTHIVLENPALYSIGGAAYQLQPLRNLLFLATVGEITCSTTSTAVSGGSTKFSQQGLGTGTWDIFRAKDWTYVGTVSSVANDTGLTLTGNAAVNMSGERYYAYNSGLNQTISPQTGFLSTTYSSRQFYANNPKRLGQSIYLWFSEENDPECIDLSPLTGDFIPVTSGTLKSAQTPIKGIAAGVKSLLICKEDETFALTGADPTNFVVEKVWDDGALSGMSLATWQDKVIYAGRNGIYAWDGTQITNLVTNTLGIEYRNAIASFDPTTYRMWATVSQDHYILSIQHVNTQIGPAKGQAAIQPPIAWTIFIYLPTGAVTLATNICLRGSLQPPKSVSSVATWALVNEAGQRTWMVNGDNLSLITTTAIDRFVSDENNYLANGDFELFVNGSWQQSPWSNSNAGRTTFVTQNGATTVADFTPADAASGVTSGNLTFGGVANTGMWQALPKLTNGVSYRLSFTVTKHPGAGQQVDFVIGEDGAANTTISITGAGSNFGAWTATANPAFVFVRNASAINFSISVDAMRVEPAAAAAPSYRGVGPNLYMETKAYPLGDPLRRKLIKQIALYYLVNLSAAPNLNIDKLAGLHYSWSGSTTNSLALLGGSGSAGDWQKRRYKFLSHDNYIAFKLYTNAANGQGAILGPWQIGFKTQAPGRI